MHAHKIREKWTSSELVKPAGGRGMEATVRGGHRLREGGEGKKNPLVELLAGMQQYREQGVQVLQDGKRMTFFCSICRIRTYSDNTIADHLKGKKHMRRMAVLSNTGDSPTESSRRVQDTSYTRNVSVTEKDRNEAAKLRHEKAGGGRIIPSALQQRKARVTISPPIVLPASAIAGRRRKNGSKEAVEVVGRRKEEEKERERGEEEEEEERAVVDNGEVVEKSENKGLTGKRKRKSMGKRRKPREEGSGEAASVLVQKDGERKSVRKGSRKSKEPKNSEGGELVVCRKTPKPIPGKKGKLKKLQPLTDFLGEGNKGAIAVFFETSEEENTTLGRKRKRSWGSGELDLERESEGKGDIGGGGNGAIVEVGGGSMVVPEKENPVSPKQEFALVLLKYDDMVGRGGNLAPLLHPSGKKKLGESVNAGLKKRGKRGAKVFDKESESLGQENRGDPREGENQNVLINEQPEKTGIHDGRETSPTVSKLTSEVIVLDEEEGGEKVGESREDSPPMASHNNSPNAVSGCGWRGELLQPKQADRGGERAEGEEPIVLNTNLTIAGETHSDLTSTGEAKENTLTAGEVNRREGALQNNTVTEPEAEKSKIEDDSQYVEELRKPTSPKTTNSLKDPRDSSSPKKLNPEIPNSPSDKGAIRLKRQARERGDLKEKRGSEGKVGGKASEGGNENSAAVGGGKGGVRGRARRSLERSCFLCRKVMKAGEEVAALLNVGEKRLACSSRNKQGMFHVFHSMCLYSWLTLCLRKANTNAAPIPSAVPCASNDSTFQPLSSEYNAVTPEVLALPAPSDSVHVSDVENPLNGEDASKGGNQGSLMSSDTWAIVSVPEGSATNETVTSGSWAVSERTVVELSGPFCPECQGSGVLSEGGELEKPKYRLAQVYEWMLELMQEQHSDSKGGAPIIVAVPAVSPGEDEGEVKP